MLVIAGTGHRPPKIGGYQLPNPIYNYICQQTEKILIEQKPDQVLTGMAQGFDSWLAFIAIKLAIPFVAVIPFEGQEKKWPQASQTKYHKLMAKASDIAIVSSGNYSAEKMQLRNQYLVDHCHKLIAVFDGEKQGGTYNCIQYAHQQKKELIIINPKSLI